MHSQLYYAAASGVSTYRLPPWTEAVTALRHGHASGIEDLTMVDKGLGWPSDSALFDHALACAVPDVL